MPSFFQGETHIDPAQFPGRGLKLREAALGCTLASSLALDDLDKAGKIYKDLLSGEYKDTMPLVCLGSLEAAQQNYDGAKDAWNRAITLSKKLRK